jgi:SAM-dependent methyltransferase
MPPFLELACTMRPDRPEDVDEVGYIRANPDVAAAGITALQHFLTFGHAEGRMQWVNGVEIARARDQKLSELKFRREPVVARPPGEPIDFLSPEIKASFDIPEQPPISANAYGQNLVDELRAQPHRKYLDLGAGLRQVYFGNVINLEIYPSYSTDVISIGEDLPFENEQFDEILAFAVLEHTKRPWDVAREMTRVLKPGGKIWVDFPFLQAVHGYPHHYFNATPQGHRSLFEADFDIKSLNVDLNQHPIYTLWWFLAIWKSGLSAEDIATFSALSIDDILRKPPELHVSDGFCMNLPQVTQQIICAGSTLIAIKK